MMQVGTCSQSCCLQMQEIRESFCCDQDGSVLAKDGAYSIYKRAFFEGLIVPCPLFKSAMLIFSLSTAPDPMGKVLPTPGNII